jgi:hypothetical protein
MQPTNRVRSKYNTGTVVRLTKNGDPVIKWDGFADEIVVHKDIAQEFQIIS